MLNLTQHGVENCLVVATDVGMGGGGEETTRGWNSGIVKDIAVIFWQHAHMRKLVYFSSQINGSFVICH